MRPSDKPIYDDVEAKLLSFTKHQLPGINDPEILDCLVRQIVDSVRRIKYVKTILTKSLSPTVADANSTAFDPLKAAVWHIRQQNTDEAFWLVFLATHFGKNKKTDWRLLQAVYGALGSGSPWTWAKTSSNVNAFRAWLQANLSAVDSAGNFGNHRKYESLSPVSARGTASAIETYVRWVSRHGNHVGLVNHATQTIGNNPRTLFQYLYKDMSEVASFGRTGKFDYLTMVGKLELANVEPASTYMTGATGPLHGARLLFSGSKDTNIKPTKLSLSLEDLEQHLGLYFGMQVLEDSLCNWQKQPNEFIHFSG